MIEETTQPITDTGGAGLSTESAPAQTVYAEGDTQQPNDQQPAERPVPRPDLVGEYNPENVRSYHPVEKKDTITNEDFWERRRREREGLDTAPQQQSQAFDLAPALQAWKPETGPQGFLQSVRESSPDSYLQLANHVIDTHAEAIAQSLVDAGILPPEALDDDPRDRELEALPDHLRDELLEHRREAEERQQQEDAKFVEAGRQAVDRELSEATARSMEPHWMHLAKTFQIGDDEATTMQVWTMLMHLTHAQTRQDATTEQLRQSADEAFRRAAALKYYGDERGETSARIEAVKYAKAYHDSFRSLLDENVNAARSLIEHFRAPAMMMTPAQNQPQPTAH